MARTTSGSDLVDGLDGSGQAKDRLKAILDTLSGRASIGEAAARLGIREAMLHRVRGEALRAALQALEPKAPGRPRRTITDEQRRIAELEEKLRD